LNIVVAGQANDQVSCRIFDLRRIERAADVKRLALIAELEIRIAGLCIYVAKEPLDDDKITSRGEADLPRPDREVTQQLARMLGSTRSSGAAASAITSRKSSSCSLVMELKMMSLIPRHNESSRNTPALNPQGVGPRANTKVPIPDFGNPCDRRQC